MNRRPLIPIATPDAAWVAAYLADAATYCKRKSLRKIATLKITDACKRTFALQVFREVTGGALGYYWRVRPPKREVVVSAGFLVVWDRSARGLPPVAEAKVAVVAPQFTGCGLYATVLQALRRMLNVPIESDVDVSAGAIASWRKAGGVLAERDGAEVYRLNPPPAPRTGFTPAEVRAALRAVGLSARLIDLAQLRAGMRIELEHGRRYPALDVTGDDPVVTAKIALAHLVECPDYYVRLARMERAPCPAKRRPRH